MRPPLRATRKAQLCVCSLAAQSIAQSTPRAAGLGQNLAAASTFVRVERHIRAHLFRQLAAVRNWLHRPDAAGARDLQTCDRQQSDGPRAEHRDRIARPDRRELERVHRDGQRLRDGRQFERHLRRNREQIRRGQIHEFAEETRVPGIAQEPDIGADVVAAGAAELTVIAVNRGFERRPVARPTSRSRPRRS